MISAVTEFGQNIYNKTQTICLNKPRNYQTEYKCCKFFSFLYPKYENSNLEKGLYLYLLCKIRES